MMKFVLVAMAVMAMSSPMEAFQLPRSGTGELADELQGFIDVMPINKMLTVVLQYVAEDAEFQELLTYLQSKEFKQLVLDIEAMPEIIKFMNFFQEKGLDIYYLVNKLNQFLGLPAMKAPNTFQVYKITGGIRGFLDDIKKIIPIQAIKALYEKKMANSALFRECIDRLRGPDSQKIADAIAVNPNFLAVLDKARVAGIDVAALKEFLEYFLGIRIPLGF